MGSVVRRISHPQSRCPRTIDQLWWAIDTGGGEEDPEETRIGQEWGNKGDYLPEGTDNILASGDRKALASNVVDT